MTDLTNAQIRVTHVWTRPDVKDVLMAYKIRGQILQNPGSDLDF